MRRKFAVLAAGVAAVAAVTATALAVVPGETPFPSPTVVSLFVTTTTYTGAGGAGGADIMSSRFPPGATVVFKVFAADAKTKNVLTADDVRYAYIKIPGQPNVKLTYVAPTQRNGTNFTGTLDGSRELPGRARAASRPGSSPRARQYGNFVQIPVETSQLTIVK